MNAVSEDTEKDNKEKPQIFFRSITFNDGTQLQLEHDSIIVFTGANNSGKSQVLKDAEMCLNASNAFPTIVIKAAEFDFYGSIDEKSFLKERFYENKSGQYQLLEVGNSFSIDSLQNYWEKHRCCNGLHTLFIKRLSTELRLTSSNALNRGSQPERRAIYQLYKSESLAQEISNYFHQAFGVDLVVNRSEMQMVPLHIGQAPDKTAFTIDKQDDYYSQVSKLPKLQEQGDGMRSFASILIDTFTSEHTITLIDEPEAFLHPPQARLLGKMLAKNNPGNRQLLISTHSEDFLQGLLDADYKNVIVIRIDRIENVNKMSILKNDEIKKLWSNPILRYSNILSGLFHEKVVVCESDYDCLFYQAIINAIYEHKGEIAVDILFTHCGGKARAKDIVSALKAVNVPVIAICDFDILDAKKTFRSLLESFCQEWSDELDADMQIIYDYINAQRSSGIDAWAQIKKIGKAGLTGASPAAYEKVEEICKTAGLFIVPVGEMECFDKTVDKEKKEWVYYILENYNLAVEPKLDDARKFVQAIVEFKTAV